MTSRPGRLALAATLALAAGCGKSSGDAAATSGSAAVPPSVSAGGTPADHLGPDELFEGNEQAFGILLPRGLEVERRLPGTVVASGPMKVHALVKYFQPRLQGGALREGETVATFEHLKAPGPEDAELAIHIRVAIPRTRVQIDRIPHPPTAVLPDDSSRWRQVGLTPDGKLLDPKHLD
jgi:hypothetical protein